MANHKQKDTSILTLPKKLFPWGRMGALKVSSTGSTIDGVFFQSGTTCTLAGVGEYDFKSIQVDAGCTLQFLTSVGWTVVGCAGNAIINGTVVARSLKNVASPVTATVVPGITFSATVAARQAGGAGGHGNSPSASGGATDGGFGGGGGTAVTGDAALASAERGGRTVTYTGGFGPSSSWSTNGTDGPLSGGCGSAYGGGASGGGAGYHGAILAFIIRGTLSTSGTGNFDLRGAVGGNGGIGATGGTNNTGCDSWGCACTSCGTASGGGGGGGSGGNGGYLELRYGAISGSFTYQLTGGTNGTGGASGGPPTGCGGGTSQTAGVNGSPGVVNQVAPVTIQDSNL